MDDGRESRVNAVSPRTSESRSGDGERLKSDACAMTRSEDGKDSSSGEGENSTGGT